MRWRGKQGSGYTDPGGPRWAFYCALWAMASKTVSVKGCDHSFTFQGSLCLLSGKGTGGGRVNAAEATAVHQERGVGTWSRGMDRTR